MQQHNMMKIYHSNIGVFEKITEHEDFHQNLKNELNNIADWNNKYVFEAGVGTGRVLSYYIQKIKKAYLTDISEAMLNYTKEKYVKFYSKLVFLKCDNNNLNYIKLSEKADIFIETYSFGHTFLNSEYNEQKTFKRLIDGCKNVTKKDGTIIFVENKTIYGKPLSYDYRLINFFDMLDKYGFNYKEINTDYHFSSTNEAYRIMNSFFGSEISDKIKLNSDISIPATAGIWYLKLNNENAPDS